METLTSPKDKIIFALDLDALPKATPFIEGLSPYVGCFKIGLVLMHSVGTPQAVQHVHRRSNAFSRRGIRG